ncbi:hypothetical protein ACLK10_22145 [Escherichia coli]
MCCGGFFSCPGRNFVTLQITTESGLCGLGDATLNGRELSVASYWKDHFCPQLIGRDASRIEDIWQFFYKGAYWRRGLVKVCAICPSYGVVGDKNAKGKYTPVYQAWGGVLRAGGIVDCPTTGRLME